MIEHRFPSNPSWTLVADPDDQWAPDNPVDIIAVLESVKKVFETNLGALYINNRALTILYDDKEPCCAWDKTKIWLVPHELEWCSYAYQFAHELCHWIVDKRVAGNFRWFGETLCEVASHFVLTEMADMWSHHAPYPNWTSYAQSFVDYLKMLRHDIQQLDTNTSVKQHIRDNISYLEHNPEDRAVNRRIAVEILPVFQASPCLWHAVKTLGSIPSGLSLYESLDTWKRISPKKTKRAINEIINLLV